MTAKDIFKVQFLKAAADRGWSMPQTASVLRHILESPLSKAALLGGVASGVGSALGGLGPLAVMAAIGAPIAAGVAGGHIIAKARDDDTDVEAAKADETAQVYRQLAEEARRRAAERRALRMA